MGLTGLHVNDVINPRRAGAPKLPRSAGGGGRFLDIPTQLTSPRRRSEERKKAFERSSELISELLSQYFSSRL